MKRKVLPQSLRDIGVAVTTLLGLFTTALWGTFENWWLLLIALGCLGVLGWLTHFTVSEDFE